MARIQDEKVMRKASSWRILFPHEFDDVPYPDKGARPDFLSIIEAYDRKGRLLGYIFSRQAKKKSVYIGILSKSGKVKALEKQPKGSQNGLVLRSPEAIKQPTRRRLSPFDKGILYLSGIAFAVVATVMVQDIIERKDTTPSEHVAQEEIADKVKVLEGMIGDFADKKAEKVPLVKTEEKFTPSFVEAEEVIEDTEEPEADTPPVDVKVETLNRSSSGQAGALLERFGTPGASTDPVAAKSKIQALKDLRKEAQNELGISAIPDPNTFVGRTQNVRMKVPGGGNLKEISDLKSFGLNVDVTEE